MIVATVCRPCPEGAVPAAPSSQQCPRKGKGLSERGTATPFRLKQSLLGQLCWCRPPYGAPMSAISAQGANVVLSLKTELVPKQWSCMDDTKRSALQERHCKCGFALQDESRALPSMIKSLDHTDTLSHTRTIQRSYPHSPHIPPLIPLPIPGICN